MVEFKCRMTSDNNWLFIAVTNCPKLSGIAEQISTISQFLWIRNLGMTELGVSDLRFLTMLHSSCWPGLHHLKTQPGGGPQLTPMVAEASVHGHMGLTLGCLSSLTPLRWASIKSNDSREIKRVCVKKRSHSLFITQSQDDIPSLLTYSMHWKWVT